jgi:phosphoribosylformylglycinamidine synthase
MKSAVIVFPGSNCDRDIQVALRDITGVEPIMVWHGDSDFEEVDLIALPGGFSYGDYLRSGAMASRSNVMTEVVKRAKNGVATLGICNGFQVLTETGLLPGALMRNAGLKFICKDVKLRVDNSTSLFTNQYEQGEVIEIPVAHHDGNYFCDEDTLEELECNSQIAFRYCDDESEATIEANPNGSLNNIAGILNKKGNILGLMPHPERLIEYIQGGTDGRKLFESILGSLVKA